MTDGTGDARPTWRAQTNLVRGGTRRSQFSETCEALYMTSGYVYANAEEAEAAFKDDVSRFIYSRYANPTVAMFEERMCLLEGAEDARAVGSGMAAVFAALICQLRAGDRVVAARALFGSCHFIIADLLPRWGIETVFVDGRDLDQWRNALAKPTQAVFFETPANPTTEVIDMAAICTLAHEAGARVVVDNVFATPLLQRPMDHGADIVVYSATKHIDGQGRALGGVILADKAFIDDHLQSFLRHTGPSLSPFNAWLLLKGLETMELRVARHCENAMAVARFLESRPEVERMLYPGLPSHPQHNLALSQMTAGGSVLAFVVAGGKEGAFRALNRLRLIDISNNLGDSKSLATHPATTTHQRLPEEDRTHLGIGPGMLRLSVGLEDVADIREDLAQALDPAA